jgi:metal-responsive CopG/Arc/MetJ family transcriptional regulator
MQFDVSFRETLVDELDDMLDAYGTKPDSESIAEFLIEQLELYADETGIDDIINALEEAGELEAPLQETLESEMSSNDEFEYTGEEIVSLLERLCHIEWDSVDGDDEDEDELLDD